MICFLLHLICLVTAVQSCIFKSVLHAAGNQRSEINTVVNKQAAINAYVEIDECMHEILLK